MTEERNVSLCEVRGCYEQATRFPSSGALKGGQYCLRCFKKPGLVKIDHFESLVVEGNPNYALPDPILMSALTLMPVMKSYLESLGVVTTPELQLSAEDISWLKAMAITL